MPNMTKQRILQQRSITIILLKIYKGVATYFLTICSKELSKLGRYMVQWYNPYTTPLPGYNTQLLILHKNPIVSRFQETGYRELTAKPKLAQL